MPAHVHDVGQPSGRRIGKRGASGRGGLCGDRQNLAVRTTIGKFQIAPRGGRGLLHAHKAVAARVGHADGVRPGVPDGGKEIKVGIGRGLGVFPRPPVQLSVAEQPVRLDQRPL